MNATRRTVLIAGALSAITALSVSSAVFAASDLVEVQSLNAANKPITVTVPKNPQRVAVADFSVLDTLDHWGLGERIVALPQTTALPYLPQYFKKSQKVTNLGTLVINHSYLRPGVVFVVSGTLIGWCISKLVF